MIDACTVCHGRGFVDICAPGGQSRVLESEECPRCALPRALRWGRKVADAIKLGEPGSGTIKAIACDLPAAAEEIERLQAENAALKQSQRQVCAHMAEQGAYYEGKSYVEVLDAEGLEEPLPPSQDAFLHRLNTFREQCGYRLSLRDAEWLVNQAALNYELAQQRLEIDDAMVERLAAALWNERALSKWSEIAARAERPTSAWRKTVSAERARSLKLLEAALNGGE